jgi:hypothetical protein
MLIKRPTIEYLVASSKNSLEAFELAQLNQSSNLRKEFRQILDEWVQVEVDGRIARWILERQCADNANTDSLGASTNGPARFGHIAMALVSSPPGEFSSVDLYEKTSLRERPVSCFQPHLEAGLTSHRCEVAHSGSFLLHGPMVLDASAIFGRLLPVLDPQTPHHAPPSEDIHIVVQTAVNLVEDKASGLLSLFEFDETPRSVRAQSSELGMTLFFESNPSCEHGMRIQKRHNWSSRSSLKLCPCFGTGWRRLGALPPLPTRDPFRPVFAFDSAVVFAQ